MQGHDCDGSVAGTARRSPVGWSNRVGGRPVDVASAANFRLIAVLGRRRRNRQFESVPGIAAAAWPSLAALGCFDGSLGSCGDYRAEHASSALLLAADSTRPQVADIRRHERLRERMQSNSWSYEADSRRSALSKLKSERNLFMQDRAAGFSARACVFRPSAGKLPAPLPKCAEIQPSMIGSYRTPNFARRFFTTANMITESGSPLAKFQVPSSGSKMTAVSASAIRSSRDGSYTVDCSVVTTSSGTKFKMHSYMRTSDRRSAVAGRSVGADSPGFERRSLQGIDNAT